MPLPFLDVLEKLNKIRDKSLRHILHSIDKLIQASNADTKGMIQCLVCPVVTLDKGELKRHICTAHVGREFIQCPECDLSFYRHLHLERHMSTKHGREKPFKCHYQDCLKTYIHVRDLNNHISAFHLNLRPYSCSDCEYKARDKRDLSQHVKIRHSSFRPFKCFCKKSFVFKSKLTRHWKAVHRGHVMKFQIKNGLSLAEIKE